MSYTFNPFTGNLDNVGSAGSIIIPSVSSDPASGSVGQIILNTTTHTIKIWYNDLWQEIHTLSYGIGIGVMEVGTTFEVA
jgi:hypothetical protein